MLRRGSKTRRLILCAGLAAVCLVRPTGVRAMRSTAPGTAVASGQSYFVSELHLRKLHLVRPDLIPYPITFEVVC